MVVVEAHHDLLDCASGADNTNGAQAAIASLL